MAALHITKDNFEAEVLKAEQPVLIDFWASWCGPCQMVAPVVEEISNEVTTAKIGKINVDEEPDLARQFNVAHIPTLVLFRNGKAVKTELGAKPKSEILKMLEE